MKSIVLVVVLFLVGCTSYMDNKYIPHKISRTQSVEIKFDLILDESITCNDPRIKSIVYTSNNGNYVVITYTNQNANKLAQKIAEILSKQNVVVEKPLLVEKNKKINSNKYVLLQIINYK